MGAEEARAGRRGRRRATGGAEGRGARHRAEGRGARRAVRRGAGHACSTLRVGARGAARRGISVLEAEQDHLALQPPPPLAAPSRRARVALAMRSAACSTSRRHGATRVSSEASIAASEHARRTRSSSSTARVSGVTPARAHARRFLRAPRALASLLSLALSQYLRACREVFGLKAADCFDPWDLCGPPERRRRGGVVLGGLPGRRVFVSAGRHQRGLIERLSMPVGWELAILRAVRRRLLRNKPCPHLSPVHLAAAAIGSTVHAHSQRAGRMQATARSLGINMAPPDSHASHVYTHYTH